MKQIMDLLQRVAADLAIVRGEPAATVNATRAAKVLGVSRRTVYTMLDDGRLIATGHGRARRIDKESLDIQRGVSRQRKDRP